MPIETLCTGCQATLRVSEEHAGRRARCPQCGGIYTVPQATPDVSAPAAGDTPPQAPLAASWHLKTPDGRVFGPVTRTELNGWARQGRISQECQLRDGEGSWVDAVKIYPSVQPAEDGNPFAGAPSPISTARTAALPHRGGLILGLGLAGLVINCPILSVMAWVMGNGDLDQIRAGTMDNSGLGLTQAGRILGIIVSVLWLIGALGLMFFMIVMLMFGA